MLWSIGLTLLSLHPRYMMRACMVENNCALSRAIERRCVKRMHSQLWPITALSAFQANGEGCCANSWTWSVKGEAATQVLFSPSMMMLPFQLATWLSRLLMRSVQINRSGCDSSFPSLSSLWFFLDAPLILGHGDFCLDSWTPAEIRHFRCMLLEFLPVDPITLPCRERVSSEFLSPNAKERVKSTIDSI